MTLAQDVAAEIRENLREKMAYTTRNDSNVRCAASRAPLVCAGGGTRTGPGIPWQAGGIGHSRSGPPLAVLLSLVAQREILGRMLSENNRLLLIWLRRQSTGRHRRHDEQKFLKREDPRAQLITTMFMLALFYRTNSFCNDSIENDIKKQTM